MKYYFYRMYRITSVCDEKEVVFQDVIQSEDRESAKKYITDKHGKAPFRKPKNCKADDFYYYLADSDKYWYDYHHRIYHIKCSACGKEIEIEGEKNLYLHKNRYGDYCSAECKNTYTKRMDELREKNNPWISEDDHFLVPAKSRSCLVGYIYRITNKRTEKSYIGKTRKPALFRWWQHLKVDDKFERNDITDLLFEVLEIVEYDPELESDAQYEDGEDKMSRREMFYITHYNTIREGYNSMLETSKADESMLDNYQLSLELEFDDHTDRRK